MGTLGKPDLPWEKTDQAKLLRKQPSDSKGAAMPGVTKEQIEAAKKMTAIEFLRRYRPEELVKGECRNEYQLREHDSFKINEETSLWHWKSRDIGGRSALDYLIYVEE